MPDIHDATFKLLFDHLRAIRDLLRDFALRDLVDVIDLDTLEQVPTEYVSDDRRQRRSDMVWRVRVRSGGSGEWLYLLVLLEFQSTVDRRMALRILSYTVQTYEKLLRGKRAPAGGKLPPVLPIVVYNGPPRWSAPLEMEELVAAVGEGLQPFQPRQRFFLVDLHRVSVEDPLLDNVLYAEALIEQGRWPKLVPALAKLGEVIDPVAEASLRRLIAELVRRALEGGRQVTGEVAAELKTFEETGDLSAMGSLLGERIDQAIDESRARGLEQGLERGLEQGLERGLEQGLEQGLERQRAMLLRQAAKKFDADTAARLETSLAAVDDPDRLVEIVDLVIDSADGDELLSRVAGAARRH